MKRTELIMGMPITIEVIGNNPKALTALAEAFSLFRAVDMTFSTYKPESEISRISRGELAPADASPDVQWVLAECETWKKRTNGYFDMHTKTGIDPSGLVKGWAISDVALHLSTFGFSGYFVDAGGDIQVSGTNERGAPWEIGIRNPHNTKEIVKRISLSQGGVATSGIYERGAHIYDPHTGKAVEHFLSLTVIGPDIFEADLIATAAFAMGDPDLPLLKQFPHLDACLITAKDEVIMTPGFARYEI